MRPLQGVVCTSSSSSSSSSCSGCSHSDIRTGQIPLQYTQYTPVPSQYHQKYPVHILSTQLHLLRPLLLLLLLLPLLLLLLLLLLPLLVLAKDARIMQLSLQSRSPSGQLRMLGNYEN